MKLFVEKITNCRSQTTLHLERIAGLPFPFKIASLLTVIQSFAKFVSRGRGTEVSVRVGLMGVCFEIGLDALSFPEKETVSWLFQTSTPKYSIYLRRGATIHWLDLSRG